MNAHSNFAPPWTPYHPETLDDTISAVNARFQRESELRELARGIIERGAIPPSDECYYGLQDWLDGAQQALDTDTDELAFMLVRSDAYDEFVEWCSRDPRREDADFDEWCQAYRRDAVVKPWHAFINNHFRADEIAREQDQLASRIEAHGRAIKADIRAARAAVDLRKGE